MQIDRDAYVSPLETAATVAAAFGLDWLPHQQAEKAANDHLAARVEQAVPHLRGFNQDKVIEILNNPQFVRTGDHIRDLARANEVAVRLEFQNRGVEGWAQQQLRSMEPALGATVERTIFTDAHFKAQAARIAASRPFGDVSVPQMNFALAVGIAQEKLARVGKAQRATRVKTSSSGPSKATSDAGIDGAIAAAMAKHGF